MTLQLLSEPYSAAGSVVSSILTRAVRNTTLDEWSVLLRETLQNSVDARKNERPVTYFSKIWTASVQERRALQQRVFSEIPRQLDGLSSALKLANLPLLIIADWNTHGLCGPTRADIATAEKPTNFRDFFLNVGREESKGYGGGTFGLGRGVLFDISSAGTIVVFSRTTAAGKPVSRLVAMGLSEAFDRGSKRFTGRHWWCAGSAQAHPEPLTGRAAEQVAAAIGLDVIPDEETGTAIMVVAPRIPDSHSMEDVSDEMIGAARLYGWPLIVGRRGKPEVQFEFEFEDSRWQPLDPEESNSPVRDFVTAYRLALADGDPEQPTSWVRQNITYGSGRAEPRPLGVLVFRHLPPVSGTPPEPDSDSDEVDIDVASIALMRKPRIVVKYLPVAKHPSGARTVGVFVAYPEFEQQFAESEPVAHDDWIPQKVNLGPNARNPVKQALDKIRSAIKSDLKRSPTKTGAAVSDGLAALVGDLLGGLVADTPGVSGRPAAKPGGKGGARPRSNRAVVGVPQLSVDETGIRARFRVDIERLDPSVAFQLTAVPQVILDSGVEPAADRPEGAAAPALLGWSDADGTLLGTTPNARASAGVNSLWLDVSQPPDTVISVDVQLTQVPT